MELTILEEKGVSIQEDFIGIFFEDINYAADGGIYAEMLENRAFEFVQARGDRDQYKQSYDGLYAWGAYPDEQGAVLSIREDAPLYHVNPHYLHVKAQAGAGFCNQAYDGLYLEEHKSYKLSFYARVKQPLKLKVGADAKGNLVCLEEVMLESPEWTSYEVSFTVKETMEQALFVMCFQEEGEAEFDCVSLFPEDAVCGLFRKDLAEKLLELRPRFVRFPGGCVVEGNDLDNRYQWKNTVGPIAQRKANWNRWAVHGNNEENQFLSNYSHYNQTLGLGYYEYFVLCEYLGAKPLPVANVGLACQYQSTQLVERSDAAYKEYIQDVLDLIEFANGAADSKWGSVRAKMGHREPFGLELIGIGNEQWQTDRVDFFERYEDFERAIHAKYPQMKLIGSAGPTVHTKTYEQAWEHYRKKAKGNSEYTYAVDEHYYMEPDWFLQNTHFYDDYDRAVKVFAGEYAAHDNTVKMESQKNNWRCALAEAAFLTGVERNADVVYLTSYAPLFARIGYTQWAPDMIWFDEKHCYGTPTYYVQKLYRDLTGSETRKSNLPLGEEQGIYHSVSQNEATGHLYIKLVNTGKEQEISLNLNKDYQTMEVTTMAAEPTAVNSIDQPEKVVPKTVTVKNCSNITLPAYSFVVLDLS